MQTELPCERVYIILLGVLVLVAKMLFSKAVVVTRATRMPFVVAAAGLADRKYPPASGFECAQGRHGHPGPVSIKKEAKGRPL